MAFWWNCTCSASAVVGDDQGAADHVGVAAAVLGGRVHDHVRARGRAAAAGRAWRRCCPRSPGRRPRGPCSAIAAMSAIGQQRVGRRLHPDRGRLPRPDRRLDRCQDRSGRPGRPDSPHGWWTRANSRNGAAVRVVRQHEVTARLGDRPQQGVLGGQAAGEGEPAAAALQRGQALLQRGPGRVGRAGVLVAAARCRRPRPGCTSTWRRSAASTAPVVGSGSWPGVDGAGGETCAVIGQRPRAYRAR